MSNYFMKNEEKRQALLKIMPTAEAWDEYNKFFEALGPSGDSIMMDGTLVPVDLIRKLPQLTNNEFEALEPKIKKVIRPIGQ